MQLLVVITQPADEQRDPVDVAARVRAEVAQEEKSHPLSAPRVQPEVNAASHGMSTECGDRPRQRHSERRW
jgi:hypothetical protein